MEKAFVLNVTNDAEKLAFPFTDKDKAIHALKVIRDKFLEDKKEDIANDDYIIHIDRPDHFLSIDYFEEDLFEFEVVELNFDDDTTDEDIFKKVAEKIGYCVNGVYHI
jgi:hypothetical protein